MKSNELITMGHLQNTGTMRISGRFGRDMEALTGRIGCIA